MDDVRVEDWDAKSLQFKEYARTVATDPSWFEGGEIDDQDIALAFLVTARMMQITSHLNKPTDENNAG